METVVPLLNTKNKNTSLSSRGVEKPSGMTSVQFTHSHHEAVLPES